MQSSIRGRDIGASYNILVNEYEYLDATCDSGAMGVDN